MSSSDDKKVIRLGDEEDHVLTLSEIKTILEVNRKAIEINIEVEKQNELVIEALEDLKKEISDIKEKSEENHRINKESNGKIIEIDKNTFRLVVILSTIGVATLISIVQNFLHH